MNKVGIITLNGYSNYGNRLQNYALQETIKMFGFECETIINKTYIHKSSELNKKVKILKFFKKSAKEKFFIIYKKINKSKIDKIEKERTKIFKEFSKQYIKETDYEIKLGKIPENIDEYKYFVVGSDQVWNPNDSVLSEISFLTFAPKYKRIAYAPSFGVSNIPNEYKESYRNWIEDMQFLSVREDAGAKIIEELTGRNAEVVIDPTMILSKEKWESIKKESPNKPNRKYILTYFLGEVPAEYNKTIKNISKKYNLGIVNLANIKDEEHYITGPSEFIDYVSSASLFFTDSFHGCVFSVLLDTPFVVCNRIGQTKTNSMESRIDTFLNKFKLNSRRFNNIKEVDMFSCDYTESKQLLEKEKEKSFNYLEKALKK